VINAAKVKRVVLFGADKQDAAVTAYTQSTPVADFPVCGVEGAEWHMDVEAAQKLVQTVGVSALRVTV